VVGAGSDAGRARLVDEQAAAGVARRDGAIRHEGDRNDRAERLPDGARHNAFVGEAREDVALVADGERDLALPEAAAGRDRIAAGANGVRRCELVQSGAAEGLAHRGGPSARGDADRADHVPDARSERPWRLEGCEQAPNGECAVVVGAEAAEHGGRAVDGQRRAHGRVG
jgi:hypothetical protein